MLRLCFHLAFKELVASRRKLAIVTLVLVVGWIGPLFASALRSSISDYLDSSSKLILGADLTLALQRPFVKKELDWLQSVIRPERTVAETELVTMARGNGVSALVEVKGVEGAFPLLGKFQKQNGPGPQNAFGLEPEMTSGEKIAWVFPEVLTLLGLKVGERITLGQTEFKITDVVIDAPGGSRTVGLAPRIYIARKNIEATGLVTYGSQVFYRIYLGLGPNRSASVTAGKIASAFRDSDLVIRTPEDAIRGFERFFRFFNLYLSTVSLVLFALSWVSAYYIFQVFLEEKKVGTAIVMINGGSRIFAAGSALIETLVLGIFSFGLAIVIVEAAIWVARHFFSDLLPEGFFLSLRIKDIAVLGFAVVATVFAYCIPFGVRIFRSPVKELLESPGGAHSGSARKMLMSLPPVIVICLYLAHWLVSSLSQGAVVIGGMALVALLGWGSARIFFKTFHRAFAARPGVARLVSLSLARSRLGVNLCFLSVLLVALTLNLIPHLLKSVVQEVRPLKGREVPAFFLFNIPESSLEDLLSFAREKKYDIRYVSPFILARIVRVNGQAPSSEQFLKFPVRLSYRAERIPSESLVSGRDLPNTFDATQGKPPEISIEEGFAERNGLKLGDMIEFDVQGLSIKALVTSLRAVKWASFNPNFFIMFQPGVLEEAPKSFIANVNLDSDQNSKEKAQFELAHRYPDLSVIDVGRAVTKVLEITNSVIQPISVSAWIAVLMSVLILIGVVNHNLRLRSRELEIEKLMGADATLIRKLVTSEYALIGLFAWCVGSGGALLLAEIVVGKFIDIPLRVSSMAMIVSFAATVGVSSLIALIATDRTLKSGRTSERL